MHSSRHDYCRQAGIIRMIKLPASVDDYGYILHDDYLAGIDAAQQAAKASPKQEPLNSPFFKLCRHVGCLSLQHCRRKEGQKTQI